ncbi:MAG: EAL domain-containing protein, partial [Steroidobacteraceae bacterium]
SHAALKGALVAAVQGKWAGHALSAVAALADGSGLPLELELEPFEHEAEPAVRLRVATRTPDVSLLSRQLEEALRLDPRTGLLLRASFLEAATERAAAPLKAGLRSLAYVAPDGFDLIERSHGPLAAEGALEGIARRIREQLQPGDLASRVAPRGICILFERGNARDRDSWIERLLERIAASPLEAGQVKISLSCSAGVAALQPHGDELQAPLERAVQSQRAASAAGGNRGLHAAQPGARQEADAADLQWAARIKAALLANRFLLAQQPIASLLGEDRPMFDLLVRMVDESGHELLPSEFIGAASRTDLMKPIDRWILGAALAFCSAQQPHRVFVRLSADSLHDASLGAWLQQQLQSSGVAPEAIVIGIPEELALANPREAQALHATLGSLGVEFALEHFGTAGEESIGLLDQVPPRYAKIDGALMQGLTNDVALQERVRRLVEAARTRGLVTIAERVEDANTMAVLWQLGVEFIQGYFVRAPEHVTLG